MLPKDEGELFRLANLLAIRHNILEQLRDCDDAMWLSWAYWVYLATIRVVLRLREKQRNATT